MNLHKKRSLLKFDMILKTIPGSSYILPSVTLPPVSALWFLSSSSMNWYTYCLPVSSFPILKVSSVMERMFSRPLLHRYNIISNHIFFCSPYGVVVSKTGVFPLYSFFRSFSDIGGWCSIFPRHLLFRSVDTALKTSLLSWKSGSDKMSIPRFSFRYNPYLMFWRAVFLNRNCQS